MKSRMRALPSFSYRGTTSTSTSLVTFSGPASSAHEDAGHPAHAGADQHRPDGRSARGPPACRRTARRPSSPRPGSGRCRRARGCRARPRAGPRRPGSGRCSSTSTGSGRRRAGSGRTACWQPTAAPRFHSSAIRVRPSAPRNFTVCGSLLPSAHGRPLGHPRRLTLPSRKIALLRWDQSGGATSLQSAIVQPDSPTADDRSGIIDAAYSCLFEPHSGAIPVAAILRARRACRPGPSTATSSRRTNCSWRCCAQETDALADRAGPHRRGVARRSGDQLAAWIEGMFELTYDDETRMHLTVIDSDEVRAAKGYRETRERAARRHGNARWWILRRGATTARFR